MAPHGTVQRKSLNNCEQHPKMSFAALPKTGTTLAAQAPLISSCHSQVVCPT